MVNDELHIVELIENPEQLTPDQAVQLGELLKEFPYFQPLHVLYTRYLKKQNLYYKNALQQTAARTIDRKVLYEIIELNNQKEKPAGSVTETQTSLQQEEKQEIVVSKQLESELENSIVEKADNKKIIDNKEQYPVKSEKEIVKQEIEEPAQKTISSQKMSYADWIKSLNSAKTRQSQEIFDVIDKFLKERPKITPQKDKTVKPPAIIEKSVEERQMLMTETLANLYVKQKKYDKAIQAFKILSLKYPKKSSYFANRIKELKKNLK